jgi:hypothetical protein
MSSGARRSPVAAPIGELPAPGLRSAPFCCPYPRSQGRTTSALTIFRRIIYHLASALKFAVALRSGRDILLPNKTGGAPWDRIRVRSHYSRRLRSGSSSFRARTPASGHRRSQDSHDKTFPIGIAFGAKVFVCDSLSFIADHVIRRKHTANAKRDLPALVRELDEPLAD